MSTVRTPRAPSRPAAPADARPPVDARASAPRRKRGITGLIDSFPHANTLSYYVIFACVVLLTSIGVLMVLSASTISALRLGESPFSQALSQGVYAIAGIAILVIASRIPVWFYRKYALALLVATIVMQALIFTPLGRGQGGNVNWIYLPGLGTLQPSEFVKLALCLALAAALAPKVGRLTTWRDLRDWGPLLALVAVVAVLLGHDLGTVMIIVAIIAGIYWCAGLDLRWFLGIGAAVVAALPVLILMNPTRGTRILSFLGLGEDDPAGIGFQTRHGLWALGTGGLSGVGLGASREKWVPLPEAHNDFIFAIVGEELGFLGAAIVVGLFAALAWAMLRLAHRHPDPFVSLATTGIMVWIIAQALINICVVIGLLPVIGVPLPLVSAGGSALISTLAAMGVVLAFARSEPGARDAFAAKRGLMARSMAVARSGRQPRGSTRAGQQTGARS